MINRTQDKLGFTVIELLVAVSIFIVLATIGMVSYSDFNRRQQITQSAKEVQTFLRSAQKKARVGERPAGCSSLRGYRVQAHASLLRLILSAECAGATPLVEIATFELPHNTRLSAATDISFNVLAGGVTLNTAGSLPATITVQSIQSANPYRYAFQIDAGGSVSEGSLTQ